MSRWQSGSPEYMPSFSTRKCMVSLRHSWYPTRKLSMFLSVVLPPALPPEVPAASEEGSFLGVIPSPPPPPLPPFSPPPVSSSHFSMDLQFECVCRCRMCLMAISIISVFSMRPRPFFRYEEGINLERGNFGVDGFSTTTR